MLLFVFVKVLCSKTGGFDESSMVLYNNVLSIPFVALLVIAFGEHRLIWTQEALNLWYVSLSVDMLTLAASRL